MTVTLRDFRALLELETGPPSPAELQAPSQLPATWGSCRCGQPRRGPAPPSGVPEQQSRHLSLGIFMCTSPSQEPGRQHLNCLPARLSLRFYRITIVILGTKIRWQARTKNTKKGGRICVFPPIYRATKISLRHYARRHAMLCDHCCPVWELSVNQHCSVLGLITKLSVCPCLNGQIAMESSLSGYI